MKPEKNIYNLLRTVSREKWIRLIRNRLVSEKILTYIDMTEYFLHHLPEGMPVMAKYAECGAHYGMSEDQARRVIRRLLGKEW